MFDRAPEQAINKLEIYTFGMKYSEKLRNYQHSLTRCPLRNPNIYRENKTNVESALLRQDFR